MNSNKIKPGFDTTPSLHSGVYSTSGFLLINGCRLFTSIVQFTLVILFLAGCSASDTTPEPTPISTSISPTPSQPQVEHRIGIRQVNGFSEFYDIQSGEKFTPRGVNYVYVPTESGYSSKLLQVGTYDPQRTRDDFTRLANLGYNTVRVFLDHCNQVAGCIANTEAQDLNPTYLDNIADMMQAAKETGIYILFTSSDLPDDSGYSEEANSGSGGKFAGYRNSYFLRPEAISAFRRYWSDILYGLVERQAAFDAVLGWEILNELWMYKDQPPLSLNSGTVETTTGRYDLSDPQQKAQMVSDGVIHFIAQLKEEILLHDPSALVTMGFITTEQAPQEWYVETASLLEVSNLDFFDLHAYPGTVNLQTLADSFGVIGFETKPIIMGEYGLYRHLYANIDTASHVGNNWVADSCEFGFDGWMYWAYYPSEEIAGDVTWALVDEDDYLLESLAPQNHLDPCQPVEIPTDNLAFQKPVQASNYLPDQPPTQAVDNDPTTVWNAGELPEEWIQINLQGTFRITEIRLLVAQTPAGNTTHHVQTRLASDQDYVTVFEFNADTHDGVWLLLEPESPLENVGQIRIVTISSPSWVAWREIQVFGEEVQP